MKKNDEWALLERFAEEMGQTVKMKTCMYAVIIKIG